MRGCLARVCRLSCLALNCCGFLLWGRLWTSRPLPYAAALDALRPGRAADYACLAHPSLRAQDCQGCTPCHRPMPCPHAIVRGVPCMRCPPSIPMRHLCRLVIAHTRLTKRASPTGGMCFVEACAMAWLPGLRWIAWLNAHLSCPVDFKKQGAFNYFTSSPSALLICIPRL